MNQKDLFQHCVADVQKLLEEGANPRELIEVLAAVSVELALQVAPSPEYAFLTVFEGLRDMAFVHAKRGDEEALESDAEDHGNAPGDETNDDVEASALFMTSATIQ